jgi:hypothetical protein
MTRLLSILWWRRFGYCQQKIQEQQKFGWRSASVAQVQCRNSWPLPVRIPRFSAGVCEPHVLKQVRKGSWLRIQNGDYLRKGCFVGRQRQSAIPLVMLNFSTCKRRLSVNGEGGHGGAQVNEEYHDGVSFDTRRLRRFLEPMTIVSFLSIRFLKMMTHY